MSLDGEVTAPAWQPCPGCGGTARRLRRAYRRADGSEAALFRCACGRFSVDRAKRRPRRVCHRSAAPPCPRCGGPARLRGFHHRVKHVRAFWCVRCRRSFYRRPVARKIISLQERRAMGRERTQAVALANDVLRGVLSLREIWLGPRDARALRAAGFSESEVEEARRERSDIALQVERLLAARGSAAPQVGRNA